YWRHRAFACFVGSDEASWPVLADPRFHASAPGTGRHPIEGLILGRAIVSRVDAEPGGRSDPEAVRLSMNWEAIATSLKLASATSAVLMIVGLPLSYWVAYSQRRWKFLVEAVVALPLVLPPTVLGFYMLVLMGPDSPLGRGYASIVGHGLPFTFEGLVVASTLYSMPFTVQPITAAFRTVDRKLIEAAWTLGVSSWDTFLRV